MTTKRLCRCNHCGVLYRYFASGHECAAPTNSSEYCPRCKQALLDALEAIPREYELRWLPFDADLKLVAAAISQMEEQEAKETRLRAEGKIVARRIFAPLFDLENPSNHNKTGRATLDGETYHVSYWTQDGGKTKNRIELRRKREYCFKDGTDRPWTESSQ